MLPLQLLAISFTQASFTPLVFRTDGADVCCPHDLQQEGNGDE